MARYDIKGFSNVAANLGLFYNRQEVVAYGYWNNYPVVISPIAYNNNAFFDLYVSASNLNMVDINQFAGLINSNKNIKGYRIEQNNLIVTLKSINMANINTATNINMILGNVINILSSYNCMPSCSECNSYPSGVFMLGEKENKKILCPQCTQRLSIQSSYDKNQYQNKNENILLGIVGALLGSLAGGLLIIVIGLAGYVTAYTGFAIGFFALYLYERFAGKSSSIGIIISVIIMLIVTYLSYNMTFAILIFKEISGRGITLMDCFKGINEFRREVPELNSVYIENLVKLFVFVIVGIVISVAVYVNKKKKANQMIQIGQLPQMQPMGANPGAMAGQFMENNK